MKRFLLLFMLFALHLAAQAPDATADAAHLRMLRDSLPLGTRLALHAEWELLWRETPTDQRAAFLALPFAEKQALLLRRSAEREQRGAEALADTLDDAERQYIDSLAPRERAARLVALRVRREFDRALRRAEAEGLVDATRKTELESLDVTQQAEATLVLLKELVLSIHAAEFARMPVRQRERLQSLPVREFFHAPEVLAQRARNIFSGDGMQSLQAGGRARQMQVLAAVSDGLLAPADSELLRAGAAEELQHMSAVERTQLAQVLERVVFARAQRPAPGLPRLPKTLMDQLPPESRDFLRHLPPPEQERFLRRRHPRVADEWNALRPPRERLGPPGAPEQGPPPGHRSPSPGQRPT